MEKDDRQKSTKEANNTAARDKNQDENPGQTVNDSNNHEDLKAGLGRYRMEDAEDWDRSRMKNSARNFDDLKNENLNAANDS